MGDQTEWLGTKEASARLGITLRSLYEYFEKRIIESNLKKNRAGIKEIVPMLRGLRDSWFEMLNGQGTQAVTAGANRRLPATNFADS